MKNTRSVYLSVWLAAAVSLAALGLWLASTPEFVLWFTDEGGPVETLTNWLYVWAMIVTLFYGASIMKRKTLLAILIVQGYMLARELDLHMAPFSMSFLKIKFWLSGGQALTDKLLAAAILLPIAWAGLYLLISHFVPVLADIRKRRAYAVSILTLIVVAGLSKIIDRSINMWIEMFGGQFPKWAYALLQSQEEMLEGLLPVLFVVALLQFRRQARRPEPAG